MVGQLFTGLPRATNANSLVLSGAKIYFYATGTTTLQQVYADNGLTTPLANPVVSDAGGLFGNIYLDPSKTYRARLTDSLGTVILDTDPVTIGSSDAAAVSFSQSGTYGSGSIGQQLKRLTDTLRFWGDFGIAADGSTDDTTAVQNAFNWCGPGKVLIMPSAKIKITSTVNYGNGTTTTLSTIGNNCTIIWGGDTSNANALIDTSDPWYSTAYAGTQFVWAGTAAGTIMNIAGPIQGLRWIGSLTLNGGCLVNAGSGAGACLVAKSFSSCTIDSIIAVNWQASGRGILMTTVDSTGISGNSNPVLSGGNRIGRLFAYSPYGSNGECIKIDGYKVASGQDFTVGDIGTIQCGICGTGAKGLVLGYVDDVTIGKLVNTVYGAISSSPYGLFLISTSTPFEAPARVYIYHAAVGQGVTVGGSTNAQVIIENYEMDDGATLPSVGGLYVKNICYTGNGIDQMAYAANGKIKNRALGNGEGYYGLDTSATHFHSLTRQGNNAHVAGYANVEFEAGATSGPTTGSQMALSTARLTMGVPVNLKSYTVATLPASPSAGDMAIVTDANAATFMTTAAGGGANVVKVTYLGGAWKIS